MDDEEKELELSIKKELEDIIDINVLKNILLNYRVSIDFDDFKTNDEKVNILRQRIYQDDQIICDMKKKYYEKVNKKPAYIEYKETETKNKKIEDYKDFLHDGIQLYKHQIKSVNFMWACEKTNNHGIKGGLLNLTMGLGKTLISLIYIFMTRSNNKYPSLVITKKGLLTEWQQNADALLKPEFASRIFYMHSSMNQNFDALDLESLSDYDIVITTYDVCLQICDKENYWADNFKVLTSGEKTAEEKKSRKKALFIFKQKYGIFRLNSIGVKLIYGIPWYRVICDESHKLSNDQSQVFRAIMSISTLYSWGLSGTPYKNYESDIWSQLRFLGFNEVDNPTKFNIELYKSLDLYKNILRMNYDDANIKMPAKNSFTIECDFSPAERYLYIAIYEFLVTKIKLAQEKKILYGDVLATFLRLRQICIIPRLIFSKLKENQKMEIPILMDKETVFYKKCAKMLKLVEIIKGIQTRKEKVIVFSQFSKSLVMCKDILKDYGIVSEIITGETYPSVRNSIIESFKKEGELDILLINYLVGSEGITLIEANNCVMLEPYWADYIHQQAYGRIWRIGQTKPCNIYYLYIKNSIEQRIVNICFNKKMEAKEYLDMEVPDSEKKPTLSLASIAKLLQMNPEDIGRFVEQDVKDEVKTLCLFIESKISENEKQRTQRMITQKKKVEEEKEEKGENEEDKKDDDKELKPIFSRKVKCEYK